MTFSSAVAPYYVARLAGCIALLAAGRPMAAQERESLLMSVIERTGRALDVLSQQPVHPTLTNVVPGSGIGAGLALRGPRRETWGVDADASLTVRGYWSADIAARVASRRSRFEAFAQTRELPKLDFFGPGIASQRSNKTNFRLRDGVVGVDAAYRLTSWLAVHGRVSELWPEVASGESATSPSIEDVFEEADAPGLTRQPRFGRYDVALRFDVPALRGEVFNQGGQYRASYTFFDDQQLAEYSFGRWELEARHRFAGISNLSRLTLHGWLSTTTTTSGQQVPFYLQRTLGGHGFHDAMREDPIGSDGTRATLRGYPNYRFRDRHALLLQAEYRIPLWGPFDVSLFADAGKVASQRSDLDLSNLKQNVGAGLSVMRGPATAARIDLAFGGGEGTRMYATLGQLLLP